MSLAKRTDPQLCMRVPKEILEQLDTLAAMHTRSRNSEVVFLLKEAIRLFQEKEKH